MRTPNISRPSRQALASAAPNARGERGAVLVNAAIALIGLIGFSALVIDYGHTESGAGETPKPGDVRFARNRHHVIATAQHALDAAAAAALAMGVTPYILSDAIEGESRDVGQVHASIARQVALHGQPFKKPCVILSGGETTVTVRGDGRGARSCRSI